MHLLVPLGPAGGTFSLRFALAAQLSPKLGLLRVETSSPARLRPWRAFSVVGPLRRVDRLWIAGIAGSDRVLSFRLRESPEPHVG